MSKYEPISTEEDDSKSPPLGSVSPWAQRIFYLLQLAIFISSMTLFTVTYFKEPNRLRDCRSERDTIFSPAEPVIEYITRTFHGAADLKSVYKGTPRKELDDAWDRLVPGSVLPGPTLRISEEELGLIGKDATEDAAVKIPAEFGGGYWATLEVFHQLHCLNLIRVAVYREHYNEEVAVKDPRFLNHVDHCVDMIRQILTCNADVGLYTAVWVKDYSEPYPDFNTQHTCRNFDKIRDWALNQELNVSKADLVAGRSTDGLKLPPM